MILFRCGPRKFGHFVDARGGCRGYPDAVTARPSVLVVEDDAAIAGLLSLRLQGAGYDVRHTPHGEAVPTLTAERRPSVILLDIGLPGIDGIEVCRRLRAKGDWTPVVFLTARDDEVDRVLGLELGADDYVTKPFSPREVLARVAALIRRSSLPPSHEPATGGDGLLTAAGVSLDRRTRVVLVDDTEVEFTAREFDPLAYLLLAPGQVFSRGQLLRDVWGSRRGSLADGPGQRRPQGDHGFPGGVRRAGPPVARGGPRPGRAGRSRGARRPGLTPPVVRPFADAAVARAHGCGCRSRVGLPLAVAVVARGCGCRHHRERYPQPSGGVGPAGRHRRGLPLAGPADRHNATMTALTPPRVVVVTGAGSGLGRAMAVALVFGGHSVVLAGRREDPLQETIAVAAQEAADRGVPLDLADRMLAVPADVTRPEQVAALFDATIGRYGRVDVLVNNAGGWAAPGSADELSVEDWQAAVTGNLTGPFLAAAEAMRRMKAQDPRGGRIVNNGSISAHVPRPRSAAYTITKHAITGLTRSIELDGRGFMIRCTQLDIGNAATDMTARMADGVPQPDGSVRPEPTFDPAHVGRLVRYVVELPLEVTLPYVTIAAAEMPWLARG